MFLRKPRLKRHGLTPSEYEVFKMKPSEIIKEMELIYKKKSNKSSHVRETIKARFNQLLKEGVIIQKTSNEK